MIKFLLLMIFSSLAFANNLSLSCSGISQFELVGATGVKEEKQEREYIFNDLIRVNINYNLHRPVIRNGVKRRYRFF